jgi:hypothetical protein
VAWLIEYSYFKLYSILLFSARSSLSFFGFHFIKIETEIGFSTYLQTKRGWLSADFLFCLEYYYNYKVKKKVLYYRGQSRIESPKSSCKEGGEQLDRKCDLIISWNTAAEPALLMAEQILQTNFSPIQSFYKSSC